MLRQVDESRITLKNLVSGKKPVRLRRGTWKCKVEDLNRNGDGGVAFMVYATTLLSHLQ